MLKIFKYRLELAERVIAHMPKGAKILKVDSQNGEPTLWALVDTDKEQVTRFFAIVGTGHEISFETDKFIGTFFQDIYVWHVFEL